MYSALVLLSVNGGPFVLCVFFSILRPKTRRRPRAITELVDGEVHILDTARLGKVIWSLHSLQMATQESGDQYWLPGKAGNLLD